MQKDGKNSNPALRNKKSKIKSIEIEHEDGALAVVWTVLRHHFIGQLLLAALLGTILIFLNVLLAQDDFNKFTMYIGIEMLLVLLIIWVYYLIKKTHARGHENKSEQLDS